MQSYTTILLTIQFSVYFCVVMKVYYDLDHLPGFQNAVITIGSFDGVHLGHQQLLKKINRLARRSGGESVVITFHPHPRSIIYPQDDTLRLLTTIDEKVALFERYGVDHLVIAPFSVEFSQLSADEYIHKFLVGRFKPRFIVIGYDHKFGLNRQGDVRYLEWHGKELGYEVVQIEKQELADISISSTKIRAALEKGDIQTANSLLGHPYILTGKVVHGQQIGTQLGFPTANLDLGFRQKLIPHDGIYAVRVKHEEVWYGGMLYIGKRPTLKGADHRTIEVNIFDFDQRIYGHSLEVELLDFIRSDASFPNMDALQQQLEQDQLAVKKCLATMPQTQDDYTTQQVAVVILNYNGRKYLERFLPGVIANSPSSTAIYVADNGSTDDSLAWLAKHAPQVKCLALPENYGFAEGYNRALQQVDADVYVLLNSDVEVTPHWLAPCLKQLRHNPKTAACQPKIKSYDHRAQFEYAGAAGGWLDSLGYPFCRGRIFGHTETDEGQYDEVSEIFWASGAALFIKADLFHLIGGFDGDYFAHAEEIDLCWRLKRAGYQILCDPSSVVYHMGGGTLNYQTPRKTYLNFRNTLCTVFKNEPLAKLWWWFPLRLLMDGLAGLLFLVQGKWQHIGAIIEAHWYFFPRMAYWWRKRKHYDQIIDLASVGPDRSALAVWPGSVVWQYYALRRRHFKDLK